MLTDPFVDAGDDRSDGIGASESPFILVGPAFGKNITSLFAEKIGVAKPEDIAGLDGIQEGLDLEPYVIDRLNRVPELADPFGSVTYRPFQKRIRSVEWPFLTATPDAIGPFWAQIKTTGSLSRWSRGVPQYVFCQCQHEMAVTGAARMLAAVIGGADRGIGFRWAFVERDEEFVAALVKACREFWDLVIAGGPAPIDSSDACQDALRRIYPQRTFNEVGAPSEFVEVDELLELAKAQQMAAETLRKCMEARIKNLIQTNDRLILTNGVIYSWSANKHGVRTLRRSESR